MLYSTSIMEKQNPMSNCSPHIGSPKKYKGSGEEPEMRRRQVLKGR